MRYPVTDADRAPVPSRYRTEPRYLGYRTADLAQPYARFFRADLAPLPTHVLRALASGMAAPEAGYGVEAAAERLTSDGYDDLETGWTRLSSGVVFVSVLTDLPGGTAQMWDWWFGWHGAESARYKLWNPEAHQFSVMGEDRTTTPGLTDRQRYVGNVSYVDEYIGGVLQPLAIRFVDPAVLGIAPDAGSTTVCARVSLSTLPVAFGWLIHQIRPTSGGAEMRSRFFLNDPEFLDLPAHSLTGGRAGRLLANPAGRTVARPLMPQVAARLLPTTIGTDMIYHCATEMGHLATFLPDLHREFA